MSLFQPITSPPIGLDIGTQMIKAVQIGGGRDGLGVTASACLGRSNDSALPGPEDVARVSRVLNQQGFQGRRVVLAVPGERLMSSVIDMPPRDSGAPYGQIAEQEFARLQQMEPGRFELAWWEVPKPVRSTSTKVMAVGCAHTDCEPWLDVMQAGGFDVLSMDVGLCAAVRACLPQLSAGSGVSALLDMGWGSARIALVHGGVIIFDRVLASAGLKGLRDRVAEALQVDAGEADALLQNVGLAGGDGEGGAGDARLDTVVPMIRPYITAYLDEMMEEVDVSFEYSAHQYPDAQSTRLVVAGGGACVPGVAEYLRSRGESEVLPAEPVAVDHQAALMATACGLAGWGDQG